MKKKYLLFISFVIFLGLIAHSYYLQQKLNESRQDYLATALELQSLYVTRIKFFNTLLPGSAIQAAPIKDYLNEEIVDFWTDQTTLNRFEFIQTQISSYFGSLMGQILTSTSQTSKASQIHSQIKAIEGLEGEIIEVRKNLYASARQYNRLFKNNYNPIANILIAKETLPTFLAEGLSN